MRRRSLAGWFVASALGGTAGRAVAAGPGPVERSQNFFEMLERGQFQQATSLFHYPESDSSERHATDVGAMLEFLQNLTATTGSLLARSPRRLDEAALTIGAGGGDVPYWSSHPEFNEATSVDYVVRTERAGILGFTLNWIDVRGAWALKNVMCNIPASRPDARAVAAQLAKPFLSQVAKGRHEGR